MKGMTVEEIFNVVAERSPIELLEEFWGDQYEEFTDLMMARFGIVQGGAMAASIALGISLERFKNGVE